MSPHAFGEERQYPGPLEDEDDSNSDIPYCHMFSGIDFGIGRFMIGLKTGIRA